MTQITPDLQQLSLNQVPWTNGKNLVTGDKLRQQFQNIHDLVAAMGTWDAQGIFSPNLQGVQDTYRYTKAINANATTSEAGGFDRLIAFVTAANTPGSNAARCLYAIYAVVGTGTVAGGDFESQLLSWLSTPTTASPPGLGLSSTTSPTLDATIAALRISAIAQSF